MKFAALLAGALALLTYLLVVRRLRYRRAEEITRKHPSPKTMTVKTAQAIIKDLAELEFPSTLGTALGFALFRTNGIPAISKLLLMTGQSKDELHISKRTVDTGILVSEFILNPPGSLRSAQAIARMNFLHERYGRSGKISPDDMLYTLSMFALVPIDFLAAYDWRPFTETELHALGVFWRYIGEAMNISFGPLPSAREGWYDGLHWLTELRVWSRQYDATHTLPSASNKKLVDKQLQLVLHRFPKFLRPVAQTTLLSIMDKRLKTALGFTPESPRARTIVHSILNLRRLFVRHCLLPRRRRNVKTAKYNFTLDRYHQRKYTQFPWYMDASEIGTGGVEAYVRKLFGNENAGPEYDHVDFYPQGFAFEDIGPEGLRGKGGKEMKITVEILQRSDFLSCPFA